MVTLRHTEVHLHLVKAPAKAKTDIFIARQQNCGKVRFSVVRVSVSVDI